MDHYTPFGDHSPFPQQRDLRAERKQIASPAFAISFIFLFTFVLQIVIVSLIAHFAPELADRDWYMIVVSSLPMYAVAMPLSLLFYRQSKAEPPARREKLGFLPFLGLLAICFALSYIGNILGTLVNMIIGIITGEMPANDLQELTVNTPLWANLLFCGILAPILEELFFRKLIIDRLLRYGDKPALLMSGVVFGLIHGNFNQFFYAAAIGILFGYIYIYTGKLRYTITLHMVFNMIGGVFATEIIKRIDLEALTSGSFEAIIQNPIPFVLLLLYYMFIGLCFIATPIAIIFFAKKIRFRKADFPLSSKEWVSVLLPNPGVWFLVAVILLLFVL